MKAPTLQAESVGLDAGGVVGGRRLFSGLGFRVAAGERWVLIGPNGAGKSSLLAALAGTFPLASGTVRLDDIPLPDWALSALAGARAWSPQFWFDPFPSTVLETACLAHRRELGWRSGFPAEPDAEALAMLDRLALAPLAHADVRTLSGGERQRVALATALLQDAPLLLLDEPASHLDPAHQRLLVDILRAHSTGGGAVIASVHDLNLAWDLASHAILIDGSGGACAGTRQQVFDARRLSEVFGVTIEAVRIGASTRFLVADVACRTARGSEGG